jgi:hypothetical protein
MGFGEVPVGGFQIGVAESFPFFDGEERDSGIFVGAEIPGLDVGVAKDNGNITGFHIGPGIGFNVGVTVQYTSVYSDKYGMIKP